MLDKRHALSAASLVHALDMVVAKAQDKQCHPEREIATDHQVTVRIRVHDRLGDTEHDARAHVLLEHAHDISAPHGLIAGFDVEMHVIGALIDPFLHRRCRAELSHTGSVDLPVTSFRAHERIDGEVDGIAADLLLYALDTDVAQLAAILPWPRAQWLESQCAGIGLGYDLGDEGIGRAVVLVHAPLIGPARFAGPPILIGPADKIGIDGKALAVTFHSTK